MSSWWDKKRNFLFPLHDTNWKLFIIVSKNWEISSEWEKFVCEIGGTENRREKKTMGKQIDDEECKAQGTTGKL